jgi:hypothetical protein
MKIKIVAFHGGNNYLKKLRKGDKMIRRGRGH